MNENMLFEIILDMLMILKCHSIWNLKILLNVVLIAHKRELNLCDVVFNRVSGEVTFLVTSVIESIEHDR